LRQEYDAYPEQVYFYNLYVEPPIMGRRLEENMRRGIPTDAMLSDTSTWIALL
jgi:hypothetical protein